MKNAVDREFTIKRMRYRARESAKNIPLYQEYLKSGSQYKMTYSEYKARKRKQSKKRKKQPINAQTSKYTNKEVKQMAHSDTWILATIEKAQSKLNGGDYWRLTWYDCDTGKVYEMTVDSAYRNWSKCGWDKLLSESPATGVYTNIRPTNRTTRKAFNKQAVPVVSADYPPERLAAVDEDVLGEVVDQLERERRGEPVSQFDSLMETV